MTTVTSDPISMWSTTYIVYIAIRELQTHTHCLREQDSRIRVACNFNHLLLLKT